MTVPGNLSSPLLATAADTAAAGANITKSVRFNSADSAYLDKTFSSASDRRTWTWAGWVKRCKSGSTHCLFFAGTSNNTLTRIIFDSDGLNLQQYDSGSQVMRVKTDAVFRDPSAWYHIVAAVDTTQSTASDRVNLYVNGVLQTSLESETYPSQNLDTYASSNNKHSIGVEDAPGGAKSYFLDGYLADVYFIGGSQLDCTSFGSFDSNGVWQAAAYSGTFGTNGFHLFDFANESLGDDSSGNNNDFTVNNIVETNGNQTIANATGALPILNTDSTGATVQSGVRADSNAGNLVLAIPGGTASGLNLTDQIPSGRSSSNASITNDGVTGTTSSSFFYGGSATVSNGNNFEIADHNDFQLGSTFTIEFWAKPDSNATGNEKTIVGYGINANNGYVIMVGQSGAIFRANGTSDLSYSRTATTDWTHFAFVSDNNLRQIYANGTLVASTTSNASATGGYTTYVGSPDVFNSNFRFTGEFQDVRFYKSLAKYSSNFTVPNISYPSIAAGNDVLFDVPANGDASNDTGAGGELSSNYPTMNPLAKNSNTTLSNGNLDVSSTAVYTTLSTIAFPSTGKFYAEFTINGTASGYPFVGIGGFDDTAVNSNANPNTGAFYAQGGYVTGSVSVSSLTALSAGDVVGVAYDTSNGKVWFSINGTYVSSGDPANGNNPTTTLSANASGYCLATSTYQSGTVTLNAGQRAFNTSAPSGFKCLCTSNLPTPTVADGSDYFEAKLYTGNGSTQTISGLEFSPDLLWIKDRSASGGNWFSDVLRGSTALLRADSTAAENTVSTSVTGFTSDGFSLGSAGGLNTNTNSHVAWAFDAGTSNASNTDGSITSTVRANIAAGFSAVTYTGNGTYNSQIGHGLGVSPHLLIVKSRSTTGDWAVYTRGTGAQKYLLLNSTAAAATDSGYWAYNTPETSVFRVGTNANVNANGTTYVAYCFAPVAGYSAIGKFDSTNTTDNAFVYTGFRPRFLLWKKIDETGSWGVYDAARNPFNAVDKVLLANTSDAESTLSTPPLDFLSNGFKVRSTLGTTNDLIYMCFAENPFQANGGLAR